MTDAPRPPDDLPALCNAAVEGRLSADEVDRTFASGADVWVEGPAELELVSGTKCVLRSGRLVATVPPPAIGFVVDTPTAVLTDLGTEFGVNVRDGKAADVQVFDGVVDGTRPGTRETVRMTTGQNRRFAADGVSEFDPNAAPPSPVRTVPAGDDRLTLSTAAGRGKDAYIHAQPKRPIESDALVYLKNTVGSRTDPVPFDRKGYAGIDLAGVAGRRVRDADLTFTSRRPAWGSRPRCRTRRSPCTG